MSEFPVGGQRIVQAGVRSIVVFRVGESFYGIRNRCPHKGGPLCQGHVLGAAVAEAPGQATVTNNPLRIACPWHGWEYDLESGQSFLGPGQAGVRSHGVATARGGALLAEIETGTTELRPGPYTAETFEVHVEDDFVVLET